MERSQVPGEGIDKLLAYLRQDPRLAPLEHKESYYEELPFYRMKVKLKREIVTMGVEGIDPNHVVGTYVEPKEWNDLISDPDVTVVDTRNYYEYAIGTFKNAVDPDTTTFREFPDYVKENMSLGSRKSSHVLYGGYSLRKSTAYMKEQGFEEVYHLKGGILKYLEEVPQEESLWEGECFVFDTAAVDHNLEKGSYDQCHGCRHPITEEDKQSEFYVPGVACPRCYDSLTPERRERFMERQKQIQLAKARNEEHIGAPPPSVIRERKQGLNESKTFYHPGIYRHYKGNDYEVLEVALHSETKECLVVYRCLYGDYSLWVRPYDMFVETVEIDEQTVPRFALVKD